MKLLGITLVLLVGVTLTFSSKAEDYHKKYIKMMEDSMTCHGGYKSLSKRVRVAAEKCSKETDMASYMCFITCTYRGYGYIRKDKNQFDFTFADVILMESFDMETPVGRESYHGIMMKRFHCATDYAKKGSYFSLKYNDAKDCAKAEPFLQCQGDTLTCKNTTMYSFTAE